MAVQGFYPLTLADPRVVHSLEKKAWLMGKFAVISLARLTFDNLRQHFDQRKEVETVLRLSQQGLSWGERGISWKRLLNRSVPYEFVELFALQNIFQENSKPEVLICVAKTRSRREFAYEVYAFRLYDGNDVRRFQGLYRYLTNGMEPERIIDLEDPTRSPVAGRAVFRHLIDNERIQPTKDYGYKPRYRRKEPMVVEVWRGFPDANNNFGNDRRVATTAQHPVPNSRILLLPNPMDEPVRLRNGIGMRSLHQTVRDAPVRIGQTTRQSSMESSSPSEMPTRSTPLPMNRLRRERDNDGERRNTMDLVWCRNELFKDNVTSAESSPRSGLEGSQETIRIEFDSDTESSVREPRSATVHENHRSVSEGSCGVVKAWVSGRHSSAENTSVGEAVEPAASHQDVPDGPVATIPDRAVATIPDRAVATIPDRAVATIPDRAVATIPDRAVATIPDRAVATIPDRAMATIPNSTQVQIEEAQDSNNTPIKVPDSPHSVFEVSESQKVTPSGVPLRKPVLRSAGGGPDADRQKKTLRLSFNPSVMVNGVTDGAETDDMTVTVHRTFNRRHDGSMTDSTESSNFKPMNGRNSSSKPAFVRGISLPVGESSSFEMPDRTVIQGQSRGDHRTVLIRNNHAYEQRMPAANFQIIDGVPVSRFPTRGNVHSGNHGKEHTSGTRIGVPFPKKQESRGNKKWWKFWGKQSDNPPLMYASDVEEPRRPQTVGADPRKPALAKTSSVPQQLISGVNRGYHDSSRAAALVLEEPTQPSMRADFTRGANGNHGRLQLNAEDSENDDDDDEEVRRVLSNVEEPGTNTNDGDNNDQTSIADGEIRTVEASNVEGNGNGLEGGGNGLATSVGLSNGFVVASGAQARDGNSSRFSRPHGPTRSQNIFDANGYNSDDLDHLDGHPRDQNKPRSRSRPSSAHYFAHDRIQLAPSSPYQVIHMPFNASSQARGRTYNHEYLVSHQQTARMRNGAQSRQRHTVIR